MRTSPQGPSAARSLFLLVALVAFGGQIRLGAESLVSGIVVDQSGQALPRAYVRALDPASREIAAAFADEAGRFRLTLASADCRISASLTGFQTATAPCSSQPLRLEL